MRVLLDVLILIGKCKPSKLRNLGTRAANCSLAIWSPTIHELELKHKGIRKKIGLTGKHLVPPRTKSHIPAALSSVLAQRWSSETTLPCKPMLGQGASELGLR
jgi:hypothetical protein